MTKHGESTDSALLPRITLMDVELGCATYAAVVGTVLGELEAGRGGWVVTPNLDILCQLSRDAELRRLVRDASFMVADGMPLVWASRLQGTPLPERVAGSDLISDLSEAAAENGFSVFLLGGAEGTADAAARVLRQRNPNLVVAGCHCPPVGFENDAEATAAIREAVCSARPDLIFVGLGFPKQERLISGLRAELPGSWWMGVGISFSYLCGEVQRAPRWVRALGLEWVGRMAQEPRRLAGRYLIQDVPFLFRLLASVLTMRLRRHLS